ncbi:hypothetical protein OAO18_01690 [Francisellaceae bacterium]|nr:hypothetical protein [Francisellaceae bacterium]
MNQIKQDITKVSLRQKLKQKLKNIIGHNELESYELKVFDKTLSRRDLIIGGAKYGTIAALIAKGALPSAWASSAPDIGLKGSELPQMPQHLKAMAKAIKLKVSCDIADGTVMHKTIEHTASMELEAVLEGLNVHPKAQETPIEVNNAVLSSNFNDDFTKTYGHPEILQLRNKPDGRTIGDYSEKQIVIHQSTSTDSYGGLHETVLDLPFTSKKAIDLESTRCAKFYDYNHIVAVNGQKHNCVENGQIHSQKMILAVRNSAHYDWYGRDGFIDWCSQQYQPNNSEGWNDYLKQGILFYQSNKHTLHNPSHAIDKTDIDCTISQEWNQIDLLGKFKESIKISVDSYPNISLSIDDVGVFTGSNNKQYIYGTIRFNYRELHGFLISLEDDEPKFTFCEIANSSVFDLIQYLANALNDSSLDNLGSYEDLITYDPDRMDAPTFTSFDGIFMGMLNSEIFHRKYIPIAINNTDAIISSSLIELSNETSFDDEKIIKKFFSISLDNQHTRFDGFGGTDISVTTPIGSPVTITYLFKLGCDCTCFGIDQNHDIYPKLLTPNVKNYAIEKFNLNANECEIDVCYAYNQALPNNNTSIHVHQVQTKLKIDDNGYVNECFNLNFTSNSTKAFELSNADVVLTRNHQKLYRVFITGDITDNKEVKHVYIMRQSGTKEFAYQYLTPKLNSSNEIMFDEPVLLESISKRVLPWNSYFQDTEYVAVSKNTNKKTTKYLIQSAKNNQEPDFHYEYITQEAQQQSWHVYPIKGKVSQDLTEIRQWAQKAHVFHVEIGGYTAYDKLSLLSDTECIEIRTNQPCYIVNLSDHNKPTTIHANKLNSYFAIPGSTGKVILEITTPKECLFGGVELQYRIVNKNQFIQSKSKPELKMVTSNAETHDWGCTNLAYLLHQRAKEQSADYKNGNNSSKNIHGFIDENFNPDYKDGQENLHHSFTKMIDQIADNTKPVKEDLIFVNLSENANNLANPLITGVSKKIDFNCVAMVGDENMLGGFFDFVLNVADKFLNFIRDAIDSALDALKDAVDQMLEYLSDATGWGMFVVIQAAFDSVLTFLKDVIDTVFDFIILIIEILIILNDLSGCQKTGNHIIQMFHNTLENIIRPAKPAKSINKTDIPDIDTDGVQNQDDPYSNHESDVHNNYGSNQVMKHLGMAPDDSLSTDNNFMQDLSSPEMEKIEKFVKSLENLGEDVLSDFSEIFNSLCIDGIVNNLTEHGFNFSEYNFTKLWGSMQKTFKDIESDFVDIYNNFTDAFINYDVLFAPTQIFLKGSLGIPDVVQKLLEFIFNIQMDTMSDLVALLIGLPARIMYKQIEFIFDHLNLVGIDLPITLPEELDDLLKMHFLFDDGSSQNHDLGAYQPPSEFIFIEAIIGFLTMPLNLVKDLIKVWRDTQKAGGFSENKSLILIQNIMNTVADLPSVISSGVSLATPQDGIETAYGIVSLIALTADIASDWITGPLIDKFFGAKAASIKKLYTTFIYSMFIYMDIIAIVEDFTKEQLDDYQVCKTIGHFIGVTRYGSGIVKVWVDNSNTKAGIAITYCMLRGVQYGFNAIYATKNMPKPRYHS